MSSRQMSPYSLLRVPAQIGRILLAFLGASLVVACGDDVQTQHDSCSGTSCQSDLTNDLTSDVLIDTLVVEDTSDVKDTVDTSPPTDLVETRIDDVVDTSADTQGDVTEGVDVADTDTTQGCGFGSIRGRVCSPNGSDWLSDVEVSISATDCDGNPIVIQDFTDAEGFYQLDGVPAGLHKITIRTGSYTTEVPNVLVEVGRTTDLAGAGTKTCLDRRSASIAVLTGTFDHVEDILTSLGITHQLYKGDVGVFEVPPGPHTGLYLLQNLSELLSYDILFINCGAWYETFLRATPAEVAQMRANLITFVQSGGSIYVSDWAYFWAELAFPDAIDFAGDDLVEGSARRGMQLDNLLADVLSDEFIRAIGSDTMSIAFNSPAWVIAESVNYASTVHIMAPTVPTNQPGIFLTNIPILVSHKPTATSGTIYFTSFHQEAQLTSSMEKVLNFLVFQL